MTAKPEAPRQLALADAMNVVSVHRRQLSKYLPVTAEERLAKLRERLSQNWPIFGHTGLYKGYSLLKTSEHEAGTCVRFFADADTFHHAGAVKHGAYWLWSEKVNGVDRMTSRQMQAYLEANQLYWIIVK